MPTPGILGQVRSDQFQELLGRGGDGEILKALPVKEAHCTLCFPHINAHHEFLLHRYPSPFSLSSCFFLFLSPALIVHHSGSLASYSVKPGERGRWGTTC